MSKLVSKIKKKVMKLVFGNRADSDSYLSHLRSIGISVGGGQLYSVHEQSSLMNGHLV